MKTLKTLLSVFAIAAVFSASAFAQATTAADDVPVSATVVSGITAGTPSGINFGAILQGDTPSISYNVAGAGYIDFTGIANGNVFDVTVTYPDSLLNVPGDGIDLADPTTGSVGYDFNSSSDPTAALALSSPSASGLVFTGTTGTSGTDGTVTTGTAPLYIYVGADIANSSNANAGTEYTGNINISVSYQ